MPDKYKKYEPIFGSWYLSELLGKGSFGEVYEITREEYGTTYKAALKIISVPQEEDDIKTRMTEGTDIDTISEYYEGVLKEIVNENEIMSKLKGNTNIVSYEDHQIIPHEDEIGYDILIRMELLTPLLDKMLEKKLEERDVVKIGIDICKALELCHKKNIIHRDIKPQNIFISENGDYKLGDFGIARTIEKASGGMSKKGTYKYMAPEVFKGEDYDSTVDIYSLGIVMYSLLNGNRGPFLPPPPAKVNHNDEENARLRRFRGEVIPPAQNASVMLSYIIGKACKANPAERYETAEQMRMDLESYLTNYDANVSDISEETVFDTSTPMHNPSNIGNGRNAAAVGGKGSSKQMGGQMYGPKDIQPQKKRKLGFIIAVVVAALLLFIGVGTAVITKGSAKEINTADLLMIPTYSGYDGAGMIDGEIVADDSKVIDLLTEIRNDKKREAYKEVINTIDYEADKTANLSNGDTVTITANYDAALAEELGVKIKSDNTTLTISGLDSLPDHLIDAIEYNGHFYKLIDDAMSWEKAKNACEKQGGHLATILDEGESDFIESLIEEQGTLYHYWLGATDEKEEGEWYWITGEKVNLPGEGFHRWCGNQPNNSLATEEVGQDYMEIQKTRGDQGPGEYLTWTDIGNSGEAGARFHGDPDYNETKYYGYICEWDSIE